MRPTAPFILGGAEVSTHELALALASRGHRVRTCGVLEPENFDLAIEGLDSLKEARWHEEGCTVLNRRVCRRLSLQLTIAPGYDSFLTLLPDFAFALRTQLEEFQPDFLLTQLEGSDVGACIASDLRIPVIHFVRDVFNPANFAPLGSSPLFSLPPAQVVANSQFTAQAIYRQCGFSAEVLYPIVQPGPIGEHEAGIFVVNPTPYKGGDILFEVAKRLGSVSFVLAPGWGRSIQRKWLSLPNVRQTDSRMGDLRQNFASATLTVVASQGPEGFGRVAVEAQASGCPVVASRHTGLEEVLSGSAYLIEDYKNPDTWCNGLKWLLQNPEHLAELSQLGIVNARRFEPDIITTQFLKLIASIPLNGGSK